MHNIALPAENGVSHAIRYCAHCEALNASVRQGFMEHRDDITVRRSHCFGGRFENIYITTDAIPTLQPILACAREFAAEISGVDATKLKLGFWFNAMGPGDVTLPHAHDDDDETLAAAYYVHVPLRSGELLVHEDARRLRIAPRSGMFVFFAPHHMHEVTRNDSDEMRLSLGINFGRVDTLQGDQNQNTRSDASAFADNGRRHNG